MSEKIYAWLLRLLPRAFRQKYEDEALQLLRDRLAEERGFLRRFRLGVDLILDLVRALPPAYRNAYPEGAPGVSIAAGVPIVPSFQILQREPLRLGALALAGIFSLTLLFAFSFLMSRAIPYHPAAHNGRVSAIESVIERLNQPRTEDLGERSGYGVVQPAPSEGERRDLGLPPGAKKLLPAEGGAAPSPMGRAEKNPQGNQQGGAAPNEVGLSIPAGQPSRMPPDARRERNAFGSADFVPAVDMTALSGTWAVSIGRRGGIGDVPRRFTFREQNGQFTGTGGPDAREQYPILGGLEAGDSVRFEISYGKRRFLYNLRFEGEGLQGTLSIPDGSQVGRNSVWFKRVQPF